MNINQLETFIWVATLGSFRKAALKLHTSQPAISSRIASLENLLDAKLFDRHAGSFELTAKGVELLPHAKRIVLLADRFKERANEKTSVSGIIRIGVSETIVHTWLSRFLKKAHLIFPNVDIEISVDITANMRESLINRSLDLAFLMGPISDYNIENVQLDTFGLKWVCSPDFGLAGKHVPIQSLLRNPIMTYARNTRPFAEIESLYKNEELEVTRLFPSSSLAAAKRMTIDNMGVGILPAAFIKDELRSGILREIRTNWTPSDLVFTASYPREPFNSAAEKLAHLAVNISNEYSKSDN